MLSVMMTIACLYARAKFSVTLWQRRANLHAARERLQSERVKGGRIRLENNNNLITCIYTYI